jgi:hypothetical protein
MKLPPAIQAYFDADTDTVGLAPITAFATDAIVKDEGKTLVGHAAVAEWWRAAKAHYEATSQPREISGSGERFTVRAEVTGTFPGSPAMLSFIFTLKKNEIATLEIGA